MLSIRWCVGRPSVFLSSPISVPVSLSACLWLQVPRDGLVTGLWLQIHRHHGATHVLVFPPSLPPCSFSHLCNTSLSNPRVGGLFSFLRTKWGRVVLTLCGALWLQEPLQKFNVNLILISRGRGRGSGLVCLFIYSLLIWLHCAAKVGRHSIMPARCHPGVKVNLVSAID